ncbi:MmgE/PrpD family protein [Saccharomonospora sp. NPDC046836]|uniref:MmgE/PrpD family protein n=1 Tax=Saccharomonospora sp. NPDC046836 TaxID=3156921 RepID=UPI0033F6D504
MTPAHTVEAKELGASPTPELCRFLAASSSRTLPSDVVRRARYLLLDGIACGLVGARLPWADRAVAGTTAVDNGTGGTLWGWDREVSPLAAALLNGTFVQGFELDDFHPHGALHSSSVVATAALAAAEVRGHVPFPDFLRALALGYETGPRVGIAMGGAKVTVRGWHTGAVFGPFAAAAAAGTIFGLDADGFESALGNAGTRASGLMSAQYKSMVKRMHHGMAAQSGLHGAALAAHGFVGTERVIEHEYGGLASVVHGGATDGADLSRLSHGLGETWTMLDIGIKRHACLIMLHSTIDALVGLRASGVPADAVERVEIGVSESVHKRAAWLLDRPGTPLGAQMNLRFAAAVALLDGAAYVAQFDAPSLARDEVWELMSKIDVHHSPEVDALGRDRRFVAHIEVRHSGGRVTRLTGQPPQDHGFDEGEVVRKFRGLLGSIVDEERIDRLEQLVLTGEKTATTGDLAALLRGAVRPALKGLES